MCEITKDASRPIFSWKIPCRPRKNRRGVSECLPSYLPLGHFWKKKHSSLSLEPFQHPNIPCIPHVPPKRKQQNISTPIRETHFPWTRCWEMLFCLEMKSGLENHWQLGLWYTTLAKVPGEILLSILLQQRGTQTFSGFILRLVPPYPLRHNLSFITTHWHPLLSFPLTQEFYFILFLYRYFLCSKYRLTFFSVLFKECTQVFSPQLDSSLVLSGMFKRRNLVGETVLHCAIRSGVLKMVKEVLQYEHEILGITPDHASRIENCWTLSHLEYSVFWGHREIYDCLCQFDFQGTSTPE